MSAAGPPQGARPPRGERREATQGGHHTSATAALLVELCTEELPPKALKRLGEAFADALSEGLRSRDFLSAGSVATPYATPRRLAVSITGVRGVAPDSEQVTKLMPAKVALQDGKPSTAYVKKLDSIGRGQLATAPLPVSDGPDGFYIESDGKADYVWFRTLAKGQTLDRGLQEALDEAIARLPIPKVMSYAGAGGYYSDAKFVRPARKLVALHGADIVPVTALGLNAGRTTAGHRFLGRAEIAIATAEAYAPTLEAEG